MRGCENDLQLIFLFVKPMFPHPIQCVAFLNLKITIFAFFAKKVISENTKGARVKINISLSVILKRVQTKSFISCCHILSNIILRPFDRVFFCWSLLKSIRVCNNHLYSFGLKDIKKAVVFISNIIIKRWMDSSWYMALPPDKYRKYHTIIPDGLVWLRSLKLYLTLRMKWNLTKNIFLLVRTFEMFHKVAMHFPHNLASAYRYRWEINGQRQEIFYFRFFH
jgi:hypothetical protein